MKGFDIYWVVTYLASLFLLIRMPTKLSPMDNAMASMFLAAFGFLLWPIFVVATFRSKS